MNFFFSLFLLLMHLAAFIFIGLIKLSIAFDRKFLLILSLISFHQHLNFFFIHYLSFHHLCFTQRYFVEDLIYFQKLLKILRMLKKPFLKSNQLHVADLKLIIKFYSIFLAVWEKEAQYNSLLKNYFFFHCLLKIFFPKENIINFEKIC